MLQSLNLRNNLLVKWSIRNIIDQKHRTLQTYELATVKS
jgi:hypothetical protein